MMAAWQPVLLAHVNRPNSERITTYLDHGGYEALRKALRMSPDAIIQEVKASGLRGRGGAGFPTGVKWGFNAQGCPGQVPAVNTDEGEPGTFKRPSDRRTRPSFDPGGRYHLGVTPWGASCLRLHPRRVLPWRQSGGSRPISDAYQYGFLGKNILDSGFDLDVSVSPPAPAPISVARETADDRIVVKAIRGEPLP